MTETLTTNVSASETNLNRDPVSGIPGAHSVGAGAASGGVAGAIAGTVVAGPLGAVIGAAVGAVTGGLMGMGVSELVNPSAEEEFWKEAHSKEPYFAQGRTYEYYAPGYRTGWEGRARFDGRKFEDVDAYLQADYERCKTSGAPDWQEAKLAARAAWDRIDHTWSIRK
jgi:hypothetical protein